MLWIVLLIVAVAIIYNSPSLKSAIIGTNPGDIIGAWKNKTSTGDFKQAELMAFGTNGKFDSVLKVLFVDDYVPSQLKLHITGDYVVQGNKLIQTISNINVLTRHLIRPEIENRIINKLAAPKPMEIITLKNNKLVLQGESGALAFEYLKRDIKLEDLQGFADEEEEMPDIRVNTRS